MDSNINQENTITSENAQMYRKKRRKEEDVKMTSFISS